MVISSVSSLLMPDSSKPSAELQRQQSARMASQPYNETGSAVNNQISLLLRLMNETFLSLPIVNCHSMDQSFDQRTHIREGHSSTTQQNHHYDTCYINWTQAKLVQNSYIGNLGPSTNEIRLSNLLSNQELIANKRQSEISSNYTHFSRANRGIEGSIINYSWAKLTYLSMSSLMSISGVLINLFIILVILFNSRQRRRSSTRSSNIGKNNLLLFQLTITGIALSGYILIDNLNIYYDTTNEFHPHHFDLHTNFMKVHQHPFCSQTILSQISLLTFLPPTPFHQTDCPNLNQWLKQTEVTTHSDYKEQSTSSLKQAGLDHETVLILKLHHDEDPVNVRDRKDEIGAWFMNNSRLVNIDGIVESAMIAEKHCGSRNEKARRKRDKGATNFFNRELGGFSENYDNIAIANDEAFGSPLRLIALNLLPLCVNTIASLYIWTVAALAYDRYCAIAHPLQYLRSIHASRTRNFIIVSWLVSFAFNLFLPILLNAGFTLEGSIFQNTYLGEPGPYLTDRWYRWTSQYFDNTIVDLSYKDKLSISPKSTLEFEAIDSSADIECRYHLPNIFESIQTDMSFITFEKLERILIEFKSWLTETLSTEDDRFEMRSKDDDQFSIEVASVLVEASSRSTWFNDHSNLLKSAQIRAENLGLKLNNVFHVTYSMIVFAMIVMVPLIMITVWNMRIYRIVKVHERRLSVSSAATSTNMSGYHGGLKHDVFVNERAKFSLKSILSGKICFSDLFAKTSGNFNIHSQDSDSDVSHSYVQGLSKSQIDDLVLNKDEKSIPNDQSENNSSSELFRCMARLRVFRNDLYQVISKSSTDYNVAEVERFKPRDPKEEPISMTDNIESPLSAEKSMLDSVMEPLRPTIKRRISDQALSYGFRRCNPITSQPDDKIALPDRESELCSTNGDSNTSTNRDLVRPTSANSEGIISQLKMAGLSFAGIAIQEPPFNANRKMTNKTSCSLENLRSTNHYSSSNNYHQKHRHSTSKCIIDTGLATNSTKKPMIMMNSGQKVQEDQVESRSFSKIFDDDNSENYPIHNGSSHHRIPLSNLGTKSAIFNILIWLIITMLIVIIPHYILFSMTRLAKVSYSSTGKSFDEQMASNGKQELDRYSAQLAAWIELSFANQTGKDVYDPTSFQVPASSKLFIHTMFDPTSYLGISSIWLSCICRILFICMIPLNGCLYGISSRSLKATLRIILKQYISKKQASIEISQRQRNTSSLRSRDSLINLAGQTIQQRNDRTNCANYRCQLSHESVQDKQLRRCLSLFEAQVVNKSSTCSRATMPEDAELENEQDYKRGKQCPSFWCNQWRAWPSSTGLSRFDTGSLCERKECLADVSADSSMDGEGEKSLKTESLESGNGEGSTSSASISNSRSVELIAAGSVSSSQTLAHLNYEDRALDESASYRVRKLAKKTGECPVTGSSGHRKNLTFSPEVRTEGDPPATGRMRKSYGLSVGNGWTSDDSGCEPGLRVNLFEQPLVSVLKGGLMKRRTASEEGSECTARPKLGDLRWRQANCGEKFRLLVTQPAEQQDWSTRLDEPDGADGADGASDGPHRVVARCDNEAKGASRRLWTRMRENWAKLLVSNSAKLLLASLVEDRCPSEAPIGAQEESLLRRSGAAEEGSREWAPAWSKVRGSSTEQRLTGSSCACRKCLVVDRDEERATSGANLKPPSFLRLSLECGAQTGLSACILSPIKECSSTHSCASSQSSLSNGQLMAQTGLRAGVQREQLASQSTGEVRAEDQTEAGSVRQLCSTGMEGARSQTVQCLAN